MKLLAATLAFVWWFLLQLAGIKQWKAVNVPTANIKIDFNISTIQNSINTYESLKIINEENRTPHKVKHDGKLTNFLTHISKHSSKLFNSIKALSDPEMRKKIQFLKMTYETNFGHDLVKLQNAQINTRTDVEKIVYKTVAKSHSTVSVLLSHLVEDIDRQRKLRSNIVAPTGGEIDEMRITSEALEYDHICAQFTFCRASNRDTYERYLYKYLTSITGSSLKALKHYGESISRVFMLNDYIKFTNTRLEIRFQNAMVKFQHYDADSMKGLFVIARTTFMNMFKFHSVIKLPDEVLKGLNVTEQRKLYRKTWAFMQLIRVFDATVNTTIHANVMNDMQAKFENVKTSNGDPYGVTKTFIDFTMARMNELVLWRKNQFWNNMRVIVDYKALKWYKP